ncbi:ABC-F family ATP-binding cassette domain-containing protein [Gulosibacter hominis]|uniref:ABC-F family ATP-binding cassette domain-containing protein n=1 Tax=Gulosibacter hominis TaxID=2770504 RepID=UPI0019188588|nr:ABC-F family ATP-binding cassette domain-containing protein [Gulosibacter hominis]
MSAIEINDLCFSHTSAPLLESITFSVDDGERACLIGPNGCGKSTLLDLVRGTLDPESGSVQIRGAQLATLSPPVNSNQTVGSYLDIALHNLRKIESRFSTVTAALAETTDSPQLAVEYDALLAAMTTHDIWSLDARINETLAGLGIDQLTGDGQNRSLSTLSPGQVGRIELAAALLANPEVLILDEPTNHLDQEAVEFLTELLLAHPGPLLMASHDRKFVDAVATVIYDLDIAPWQAIATATGTGALPGIYRCSGTYSDYLVAKQQARATHQQLHGEQQATKRNLKLHRSESSSIAHGGVRLAEAEGKERKFFADRAATTATRRTRSDDHRLRELEAHEVRRPREYELQLSLHPVRSRTGLAVMARAAEVRGRLSSTTFDLAHGESLLVTGANGSGKSTLLTWLVQGTAPGEASGTLTVAGHLAAVPQRLPQLGDAGFDRTVWRIGIGELGAGVLHPSMWHTPISSLSEGNQRRAQLAVAIAQQPEVLVVDEPTNYLDLDTIEALEAALFEWNGTLVVATHDRWLIEKWDGAHIDLQLP